MQRIRAELKLLHEPSITDLETITFIQRTISQNLSDEKHLLVELIKRIVKNILGRDPTDDDLTKVVLSNPPTNEYTCEGFNACYGFAFDSVIYGTIKAVSQHNLGEDTYRYRFTIGYEFLPSPNYLQ